MISARLDERQVLPLAMFFGSFSWSFVYISLPFHIQRISTWDAAATLTWTGWIMGITPLATVATAPLWGRWAERGNPKTLYGAFRFLQVMCIAPVFPLAVARIAHSAGGVAIGVVNSGRIGAAFLGPVIATTLLAWTAPAALYATLALIGLACVPLARAAAPRRA